MQEQLTSCWSSGHDVAQQMDHFKLVIMAAALLLPMDSSHLHRMAAELRVTPRA